MIALKKFTLLVLCLLGAGFAHGQIHNCFISDSSYPVKFLVETEPVKGKTHSHYSIARVYSADDEKGTNKKLLSQGPVKNSSIKEAEYCRITKFGDNVAVGDHKYILILRGFYSNDSGKTFKHVSDIENDIRRQFNTGDFYYASLRDEYVWECGNAASVPHEYILPTLTMAFAGPTRDDSTCDLFKSRDGGATWKYEYYSPYFNKQHEYYVLDSRARFNGDLKKYVDSNLKYPQKIKKGVFPNAYHKSSYVEFVVDETGRIRDVKVPRVQYWGDCDSAAVNLVKNMPKWVPARSHGKSVRSGEQLTIEFYIGY